MTEEPVYPIVTKDESALEPYPYVYVNADGTVRELNAGEREYLETSFSPFDGGRPFVKESHLEKNGWKNFRGFLQRARLSAEIQIIPDPSEGFIRESGSSKADR
jgi:hypothetical protein